MPILDVFADQHDPATSYIVMPLLRPFDHPPMEYVSDAVDFVDQLLEVRLRSLRTRFGQKGSSHVSVSGFGLHA